MKNYYALIQIFLVLLATGTYDLVAQKTDKALSQLLENERLEGVILLYDHNKMAYTASDRNESMVRSLPASTYKIFHSLVLLEVGAAPDTNFVLEWDGTVHTFRDRPIDSWNKNTSLAEAFRNSTVWYYVALRKPILFDVYKRYMKESKYGLAWSRREETVDFWNYGRKIEISPKDQIKFLIKLKENKLTFRDENMEKVKELMVEKRSEDLILRSKTGLTSEKKCSTCVERDLGWYIGYIETDDNVYYFATRLEKDHRKRKDDFSALRKQLTWKALEITYGLEID